MDTENRLLDREDSKEVVRLLTPSWLSGLVAIVCGLAVSIGVILVFSFNNSQIQQQLVGLQDTSTPTLTLPGQSPPAGNSTNSLQNTWPLLGFWAIVGLIVYFIVESIAQALNNLKELREELEYVHARRDILIKTTAEKLFIRVVAVIIWLFFIQLFFKRIIPYSILAAHASASDLRSTGAAIYELLSFTMVVLSLHAHTIFLRLAFRRIRVFSSS